MEDSGTTTFLDYVVFAVLLAFSSAIGIYYGCKTKRRTTKDYLIAGGDMHWFPISLSLLASFFSAVGMLGIPSEVYTYGFGYLFHLIGMWTMMLLAAKVYAPIFYATRLTSANEYLELRFSSGVRLLGCILLIFQYVLYLSVVLYAPSLALKAVANVPLTVSILVTGAVCTFYTTLGGMRAVIWTDVLQCTIMVAGMIFVVISGVINVGGVANVIKRAERGNRTTMNWNPDPTVRSTVWTYGIGGIFALLQNWTTSQVSVQRFLSARSLQHVKKALYFNILLLTTVILLCVTTGIVMYAVYADCDPKSAGQIMSNDQIVPYFVVTKLGHLKGITGVYMAVLMSGSLSTASSGLNSLAAVTLEDIIKRINPTLSDRMASIWTKVCSCFYGIMVVVFAFLVSYAGSMVLQLAVSIFGVLASPQLGIFTLGMLVPRATSKGAYAGAVTGTLLTAWLAFGALLYPPDRQPAPVSIYKCPMNSTVANFTSWESAIVSKKFKEHDFPLAKFHSISYMYFSLFGIVVTYFVGWLVTVCGCNQSAEDVNPALLYDYKSAFLSCLPNFCRPKKSHYDVTDSWEMKEMIQK